MSSCNPVDAFVALSVDIARRSFGVHSTSPALWPVPVETFWPRIRKVILDTSSPWQALDDVGLHLSPPPTYWPYLVDISTGTPQLCSPCMLDLYELRPLIVAQIFCPACARFGRHILDGSVTPLQSVFDSVLCPLCQDNIWPWPLPSSVPLGTARNPSGLSPATPDNILSFTSTH